MLVQQFVGAPRRFVPAVLVGLRAGFREVDAFAEELTDVGTGEIQAEVVVRDALEPRSASAVEQPALARDGRVPAGTDPRISERVLGAWYLYEN